MTLALSLTDQYTKDRAILTQPISTLAKRAGLHVNDVYKILLPELAKKDLGEVIRFAEVGLRYASIVDRNRLREECGPEFITTLSMIIKTVQSGLESKENWIKRKAIKMHGDLIDEQAEKQRFIEVLMTEQKLEMLKKSQKNLSKLEEEIMDIEVLMPQQEVTCREVMII
jgi:hypothetical protein